MKRKFILTNLLLVIAGVVRGQDTTGFEYKPYFSAVVVSNVDSSVKWYSAIFGLKIKNEIKDTQNTYHIFILESPGYSLELLQLKGSIAKSELLKGKPEGTQVQGHFKIGFKVGDMDACIKRLMQLNIDVGHIWAEASTGKRNFIIKDPDGNLIQFFE